MRMKKSSRTSDDIHIEKKQISALAPTIIKIKSRDVLHTAFSMLRCEVYGLIAWESIRAME
jgi:hypothetical protein